MAARSPRIGALLRLLAAHRELTKVEWIELRQNLLSAAIWGACTALAVFAGWLAINVAVVLALHREPLVAIACVIGFNLLLSMIGALRVRSLLRRPAFALTRTEVARDVRTLTETLL